MADGVVCACDAASKVACAESSPKSTLANRAPTIVRVGPRRLNTLASWAVTGHHQAMSVQPSTRTCLLCNFPTSLNIGVRCLGNKWRFYFLNDSRHVV